MTITEFQSEGIILRKTRYKENRYILKVFTPYEGLMDAGVQCSMKGKILPSLLEPMNILDFNFKKNKHPEHWEIKDVRVIFRVHNQHPSVFLFLSFIQEIALRTIPPRVPDKKKYSVLEHFISNSSFWNDSIPSGTLLHFLRLWAEAMGLLPVPRQSGEELYFSISESRFVKSYHPDGLTFDKPRSDLVHEVIMKGNVEGQNESVMVTAWLQYLQYHVQELRNLKSLEVIKSMKYA
ncbi:MAG: recombination protein O N-terminal domain-containing protein [Bacteroidia bacterium]|nr:recombination protein O N-terminal domain-containing protein [Bacteroidia bacterium]